MNRLVKILPSWCLGCCAAVLFFSASSCEKFGGDTDVLMESQRVGYVAGSQKISVQASGKWTLTLFFPDGEPWAELSATSGSGSKDGIVLSYGENAGEHGRTCRIILTNNGTDAVRNVFQMSKDEWELESKGVPLWLELPALSDGLGYYNHHFSYGGSRYRNYSFAWDKDNLVAHWVAYPLCKFYTNGNVGRTEEWAYDPSVKKESQPNMYGGLGGGYDRGHQLPSADRQLTRVANEQTFYYTNMTPQLGANFNRTVWASLEGRVRSYSDNSDTLYVVTGCTLKGSLGTHRDNDGKSITVPGGYFKALLRYRNGSYMGAAFFLEHKRYSGDNITSSMLMSIDELEEKVGMDFFPNLESLVGKTEAAEVEAEDPHGVSFWGI